MPPRFPSQWGPTSNPKCEGGVSGKGPAPPWKGDRHGGWNKKQIQPILGNKI